MIQRKRHPFKTYEIKLTPYGKIILIAFFLLGLGMGFAGGIIFYRFYHENIPTEKDSVTPESQEEHITGLITKMDSLYILVRRLEINQDSILKNIASSSHAGTQSSSEPAKTESPRLNIQILNGCGVKDITNRFAEFLQSAGYGVESQGNYKNFNVSSSFIISQENPPDQLYQLADLLGLSKKDITVRKVQSQSKYILIIGKDYKKLRPFSKKN